MKKRLTKRILLGLMVVVPLLMFLVTAPIVKAGNFETGDGSSGGGTINYNYYTDSDDYRYYDAKNQIHITSSVQDYLYNDLGKNTHYTNVTPQDGYPFTTMNIDGDDPITEIVPKELFKVEGNYTHVGSEYGFFISTKVAGSADWHHADMLGYDYSGIMISEVFVFDIDVCYIDNVIKHKVVPLFTRVYIYASLESESNGTTFSANMETVKIITNIRGNVFPMPSPRIEYTSERAAGGSTFRQDQYALKNVLSTVSISNLIGQNIGDLGYSAYDDIGAYIKRSYAYYSGYGLSDNASVLSIEKLSAEFLVDRAFDALKYSNVAIFAVKVIADIIKHAIANRDYINFPFVPIEYSYNPTEVLIGRSKKEQIETLGELCKAYFNGIISSSEPDEMVLFSPVITNNKESHGSGWVEVNYETINEYDSLVHLNYATSVQIVEKVVDDRFLNTTVVYDEILGEMVTSGNATKLVGADNGKTRLELNEAERFYLIKGAKYNINFTPKESSIYSFETETDFNITDLVIKLDNNVIYSGRGNKLIGLEKDRNYTFEISIDNNNSYNICDVIISKYNGELIDKTFQYTGSSGIYKLEPFEKGFYEFSISNRTGQSSGLTVLEICEMRNGELVTTERIDTLGLPTNISGNQKMLVYLYSDKEYYLRFIGSDETAVTSLDLNYYRSLPRNLNDISLEENETYNHQITEYPRGYKDYMDTYRIMKTGEYSISMDFFDYGNRDVSGHLVILVERNNELIFKYLAGSNLDSGDDIRGLWLEEDDLLHIGWIDLSIACWVKMTYSITYNGDLIPLDQYIMLHKGDHPFIPTESGFYQMDIEYIYNSGLDNLTIGIYQKVNGVLRLIEKIDSSRIHADYSSNGLKFIVYLQATEKYYLRVDDDYNDNQYVVLQLSYIDVDNLNFNYDNTASGQINIDAVFQNDKVISYQVPVSGIYTFNASFIHDSNILFFIAINDIEDTYYKNISMGKSLQTSFILEAGMIIYLGYIGGEVFTGFIEYTIVGPVVEPILDVEESISLYEEDEYRISTNVYPTTGYTVIYQSGDTAIATVTSTGKITGISAGTTTITVYLQEKPAVRQEVQIVVNESVYIEEVVFIGNVRFAYGLSITCDEVSDLKIGDYIYIETAYATFTLRYGYYHSSVVYLEGGPNPTHGQSYVYMILEVSFDLSSGTIICEYTQVIEGQVGYGQGESSIEYNILKITIAKR